MAESSVISELLLGDHPGFYLEQRRRLVRQTERLDNTLGSKLYEDTRPSPHYLTLTCLQPPAASKRVGGCWQHR